MFNLLQENIIQEFTQNGVHILISLYMAFSVTVLIASACAYNYLEKDNDDDAPNNNLIDDINNIKQIQNTHTEKINELSIQLNDIKKDMNNLSITHDYILKSVDLLTTKFLPEVNKHTTINTKSIEMNSDNIKKLKERIIMCEKCIQELTNIAIDNNQYLFSGLMLMTKQQLERNTTLDDYENCTFDDILTEKQKYAYSLIRTLIRRYNFYTDNDQYNNVIEYLLDTSYVTKNVHNYIEENKDKIEKEIILGIYDKIINL